MFMPHFYTWSIGEVKDPPPGCFMCIHVFATIVLYASLTYLIILSFFLLLGCSSGFGVQSEEDDNIKDESGVVRKLNCGTEKGKHKSKNNKTAGNFAKNIFLVDQIIYCETGSLLSYVS